MPLAIIEGNILRHVMSKGWQCLCIGIAKDSIEGIRSLIVLMTIFCTSSRFIVMLCIMHHSHLRCFGLSTYLASISYSHRRYLCMSSLSFRPSIFTSLIAQVMGCSLCRVCCTLDLIQWWFTTINKDGHLLLHRAVILLTWPIGWRY